MRAPPTWTLAGAVLLLAAGCSAPPAPTSTPDGSPPTSSSPPDSCAAYAAPVFNASGPFDGGNGYGHVLRLTCDFSARPPREQARVPGTQQRVAAALYAESVLRGHGWRTSFENFTGTDYDALEKGSVRSYTLSPHCDAASRQRLSGLAFSNVVAELGSGSDLWIGMAHYDSKRFATQDPDPVLRKRPVLGANDGASGVGVWLEAARVLAPPANGTVRILLVDGEDGFQDCHPLAGSLYHAQRLNATDRARVRGVLLLDMVGDAEARYCYAHNAPGLRRTVVEAANGTGAAALATAPDCDVLDDHTAFQDRGVAAVDLIDFRRPGTGFPPYWHTAHDTPDKLSPAMLADVGRTMVAAFTALRA